MLEMRVLSNANENEGAYLIKKKKKINQHIQ